MSFLLSPLIRILNRMLIKCCWFDSVTKFLGHYFSKETVTTCNKTWISKWKKFLLCYKIVRTIWVCHRMLLLSLSDYSLSDFNLMMSSYMPVLLYFHCNQHLAIDPLEDFYYPMILKFLIWIGHLQNCFVVPNSLFALYP